jgi:hypothetical protein
MTNDKKEMTEASWGVRKKRGEIKIRFGNADIIFRLAILRGG